MSVHPEHRRIGITKLPSYCTPRGGIMPPTPAHTPSGIGDALNAGSRPVAGDASPVPRGVRACAVPPYRRHVGPNLGAPSSTSLKGTAAGGSGGEGGLSKQLQHRNSQHSQSAHNPQGEKQPQEDDLDRLLEMEMATAVGSENSSSAVR